MISTDSFITRTVEQFGIARTALLSPSRQRDIVAARHALAYALRHRTALTLVEIGSAINRRDHTTVMHAISRAEQRAVGDYDYALKLFAVME